MKYGTLKRHQPRGSWNQWANSIKPNIIGNDREVEKRSGVTQHLAAQLI